MRYASTLRVCDTCGKATRRDDEIEMCELDVMIRRLFFSGFSKSYKFEDVALIGQIVLRKIPPIALQLYQTF